MGMGFVVMTLLMGAFFIPTASPNPPPLDAYSASAYVGLYAL